MKKNKILWIVLPVAVLMIAAVVAVTVLLLTGQNKQQKYSEQMAAAQRYLEAEDYEKVIMAYEAAIEMNPQAPEAYEELAEFYIDQGKYYTAQIVAEDGWKATGDSRFQDLMDLVETSRQFEAGSDGDQQNGFVVEGTDSENLVLRNVMVEQIGEYCYQQYVNEYGEPEIQYISSQEGCKVKFPGLNAYAYFKNTPENENAIDDAAKKPTTNAVPYKVEITSPGTLFVGYEGYVSISRFYEMFPEDSVLVYDEETDTYHLEVTHMGCTVQFQTDSQGNMYDKNPLIVLLPLNLISDWVEEEPEEEPEVEPDTFVLAGVTYTYDVKEIFVMDAVLEDLSPLEKCKNLTYLAMIDCEIQDLSPLAGCTALKELVLDDSTGNLDLSCLSGLTNLKYLHFHECKDISDIAPIMELELELLHPCASSVSREQIDEYIQRHPNCEVWFDYYRING